MRAIAEEAKVRRWAERGLGLDWSERDGRAGLPFDQNPESLRHSLEHHQIEPAQQPRQPPVGRLLNEMGVATVGQRLDRGSNMDGEEAASLDQGLQIIEQVVEIVLIDLICDI